MAGPALAALEDERVRLYAQLSMIGDFRRGSVSENRRNCGKPNCACAAPAIPATAPDGYNIGFNEGTATCTSAPPWCRTCESCYCCDCTAVICPAGYSQILDH